MHYMNKAKPKFKKNLTYPAQLIACGRMLTATPVTGVHEEANSCSHPPLHPKYLATAAKKKHGELQR